MATEFNTQIGNGEYRLQFETNNEAHYLLMQSAARRCVDRGYVDAKQISEAPTVDAVPVSELEKLRDYLYAEDLIFMRGLAELNKLIANCGERKEEVSE